MVYIQTTRMTGQNRVARAATAGTTAPNSTCFNFQADGQVYNIIKLCFSYRHVPTAGSIAMIR